MSILTIKTTTDFTRTVLAGVSEIRFANGELTTVNATFSISQFDDDQISMEPLITGSGGFNQLTIKGSTINLETFFFSSWSSADLVTLQGTSGIDALTGGHGRDILNGGDGDDFLTDTVGANKLNGGGGDDQLVGDCDGLADHFDGGTGNDSLTYRMNNGGIPPDTLVTIDLRDGGGGRDIGDGTTIAGIESFGGLFSDVGRLTFWGGIHTDFVVGSLSGDFISGMEGDDDLFGVIGVDILLGDAGDDTLGGGADRDLLTGGTGIDTFDFGKTEDSATTKTRDTITDFVHRQDKIDLSGIDADVSSATHAGLVGDQAFKFIASQHFHGVAGELRYVYTPAGNTMIYGDVNADAKADFVLELLGKPVISGIDFVL